MIIVIFGALFASSYLNFRSYFKPYGIFIHCIALLSVICYSINLFSQQFVWFAVGDVFNITALSLYWISAIYLFKKNMYSKFFVLAYTLLLFMGYDYFVAPLFNLPSFNISSATIKWGGVFEVLVLTYGIIFRMNTLNKEYRILERNLSNHLQKIDALSIQLHKLKIGESNPLSYANLSIREIEVLTLLSEGKLNKEIAETLNISNNTVKFHVKNIYAKLGTSSRKDLLTSVIKIEPKLN